MQTPPPADKDALDPVGAAILAALAAAKPGRAVSPEAIARAVAAARARPSDPPDAWRRYLTAVKQQAVFLARQGRIEILRKGKPVDPNDFKGVIRLRLAADESGPSRT
jgi:hypothetical protein